VNEVLLLPQLVSFFLPLLSLQAFSSLSVFIYGCDDAVIENESFQLLLFFELSVTSFHLICASDALGVFSLIFLSVLDFSLVILKNFFIIYRIFFYVFLIF
jgi:hypothetical protein